MNMWEVLEAAIKDNQNYNEHMSHSHEVINMFISFCLSLYRSRLDRKLFTNTTDFLSTSVFS